MKKSLLQKLGLLGIVSFLSYAAAVIFSPLAYPNYNRLAQAVSDLSAANAPSLSLWNRLSAPYAVCEPLCAVLCCIGVQPRKNKPLRAGVYLFAVMECISAVGYRMFPLSDSGYAGAFQDVMHMVITAAVVLLSVGSLALFIIAGAKDKSCRSYGVCAAVALAMMLVGALGTKLAPAKYFGAVERCSVFAATGFNAALGLHLFLQKPESSPHDSTATNNKISTSTPYILNYKGETPIMKNTTLIIRNEEEKDYKTSENLTREAFWNVYLPGAKEHFVLHRMRTEPAFVPELDFVMELNGEMIAQVAYARSEIECDNGEKLPVLTFGPIGVAPAYKRRGYGKLLLDFSMQKAKELGAGALFITGNIDFYGKSGFVPAKTKGVRYADDPEADYFLVKELKDGFLNGVRGTYKDPELYFVCDREPADFERFDAEFPKKEKLRLPEQLF